MIGPWFLATFAAATGLDRLDYVMLLPSVETCVQRVATRAGHGFTDEAATRKMYAEFADGSTASLPARHVITDPPNGVAEVADLIIQAFAAGHLAYDISS